MRRLERLSIAAFLSLGLASCNTTDALTPQADVGGGTARSSSPVTQADTDRMAQTGNSPAYRSSSTDTGAYSGGPQNTLEAQAQALQSGNAVSPASSGEAPQWQDQEQDQNGSTGQTSSGQALPQTTTPPTAGATTGSIRFLPIIGAPVQAITPLSRQLGADARANGLTIRPSTDTGTEQILKGYLSAFADSGKVTVIYVWDVLDNSGARIHRMQGQESVPGEGSDPWALVPASLMQSIASKTIRDYLAWRQSQSG